MGGVGGGRGGEGSFCNCYSHFFFNKNINLFAIFQNRNFNVTLGNKFDVLNNWSQIAKYTCSKFRASTVKLRPPTPWQLAFYLNL